MEFLSPREKTLYGIIQASMDGVVTVLAAAYYQWVSPDHFWFTATGVVLATLGTGGLFAFVSESPLWLLKVGRRQEAASILTKMAKQNGLEV